MIEYKTPANLIRAKWRLWTIANYLLITTMCWKSKPMDLIYDLQNPLRLMNFRKDRYYYRIYLIVESILVFM